MRSPGLAYHVPHRYLPRHTRAPRRVVPIIRRRPSSSPVPRGRLARAVGPHAPGQRLVRAGRVACRALAGRHARSAHRGSGQAQDPDWTESALIDDLRWLGLDWDEGPYRQSERTNVYATWVGRLNDAGLTYPCFCTRAPELHAAEAPHASDGTPIYPGTCRGLTSEQIEERLRTRQRPPATRLVVPDATNLAGTIEFADGIYGLRRECLAEECNCTVRRSDGVFAYQLAVTVDDALMGVTQVVSRA